MACGCSSRISGYNRILGWNSIPAANAAPADFAIGQPDLTSSLPNNALLDRSERHYGQADAGALHDVEWHRHERQPDLSRLLQRDVNFPRFALSTGNRLFISDGGNDRVLVFNQIPTQSGASADVVIGQIGGSVNQASDAADSLRTPMSLAWDGTEPVRQRRLQPARDGLFARARPASLIKAFGMPRASISSATGTITIRGTIQAKDVVTLTISGTTYSYTVLAADTLESVVQALVNAINSSNSNAGDPNVLATADLGTDNVVLTAKTREAPETTSPIPRPCRARPRSRRLPMARISPVARTRPASRLARLSPSPARI